ncbi:hypothetical protein QP948_05965 [Corynebacterium bovis]|uniref:hypothetical protein n=1 Tax=Corynebacterium bovis TaxID=36808 RepID=UPI00254FCE32|nr:hypothetical protein [Corynebacterium bovis]MDK8510949.1 hypothetical protein [Corynebacterium bovis]
MSTLSDAHGTPTHSTHRPRAAHSAPLADASHGASGTGTTPPSRRRTGRIIAGAVAACALGTVGLAGQGVAGPVASAVPAASAPAGDTTAPAAPADLQHAVDRVAQQTGATLGVSLIHADGTGAQSAGPLQSGPAWSTSKIPVSVAALRKDPALLPTVQAAIEKSDNAAATTLWESLGTPEEAGRAAEQVLRDGGDTTTHVETRKVRPEFTSFGQTQWSLADQAAFITHLPQVEGAAPVLDAMHHVIPEQAYGLGTLAGAAFKGGWGPDESGRYLVRQVALVDTPAGPVGVAVAVQPADGTYEAGQTALTALAGAIRGVVTGA